MTSRELANPFEGESHFSALSFTMAAVFEEIRKSATGAVDKAKLAFVDPEEEQQPDRLEELAEYCPKLTFQQVSSSLCHSCKRIASALTSNLSVV